MKYWDDKYFDDKFIWETQISLDTVFMKSCVS